MITKRYILLAGTVCALAASAGPAYAQNVEELKRLLEQQQRQIELLMQRVGQLEGEQKQSGARLRETEAQQQQVVKEQEQIKQEQQQAKEAQKKSEEQVAVGETPVTKRGQKRVRLGLSGQVNRGVLYGDNGNQQEFFFVDNDNSSTRVRFVGEGDVTEDVTLGTNIEVQFESNSTGAIRFGQDSPAGPNNFTKRHLEFYVDSKRFGRGWLGFGDTATKNTAQVDLSGTGVIAYSAISDLAGGLQFNDTLTNTLGPTIGSVYSNMDGLGRDDRFRYDTPSLGPVKLSSSLVDGGSWDLAGKYAGKLVDTKTAAGIGYGDANSRQGYTQLSGSGSVLFAKGFNLTGAAGARDVKGRATDPMFWYVKGGYQAKLTHWGPTAFAVDYAQAHDLAVDGDDFSSIGGVIVQNFSEFGTQAYLGLRVHSLDRVGTNFDDVLAVLVGGRVKF